MEVGDKVYCKKNFTLKQFDKGEKYTISDIDYDFGIVTIEGFDFYLVDGGTFFFEEYFYLIREMRKLKLQNIKDRLRYK